LVPEPDKVQVLIGRQLKYKLSLHDNTLHKFGNKTANINIKICSLSTVLTATDPKLQKSVKKVVLLSITLTFR